MAVRPYSLCPGSGVRVVHQNREDENASGSSDPKQEKTIRSSTEFARILRNRRIE
jgi:hypothetical protein